MNKIFKTRLLSLICVVMTIAIVSSCRKDNNVNSGQVELLSFGPTGAMHGDTIRFFGRNLNKVTSIDFTGAGANVAQAAFIQQTPELILLKVPMQAEPGFVTLKTADGDIVSKTRFNLEVLVTITEIPKEARPGDNITIKGTYMNWVNRITFAKGKTVNSFVSKSLNELVVTVPMDAQTGELIISTGGTEPLEITTDSSLKVTLPSLTGIAPNPAEREKNITITGTNLDLVKGVLFKGKTTADTVFVSKSATQIVIKVPKEANKGKITLVAYSGLIVESTESLLYVGDLPDLAPLRYALYVDKLENGWQNWGWGSTANFTSADNVRDGVASISMDYTAEWGALKFANVTLSTAAYSEFTFSVFGTPGTGGKKINVTPSGGKAYTVVIEEGKWVDYKLTMAQIGNPATIKDITFGNEAWKGKVYIDHVGFR